MFRHSFMFQWTFQKEGEGIGTPVSVIHWGINFCSNVHEAWNITSRRWAGITMLYKEPDQNLSRYTGLTSVVIDRSYCLCGEVKNPAKITFSGEVVNGVYLAKLLTGELNTVMLRFKIICHKQNVSFNLAETPTGGFRELTGSDILKNDPDGIFVDP